MRFYQGLSSLEDAWSLVRNDPATGSSAIGVSLLIAVALIPFGFLGIKLCLWLNKRFASPNGKGIVYVVLLVLALIVPNYLLQIVFDNLGLSEYFGIGQIVIYPVFLLSTAFLASRQIDKQNAKPHGP